MFFAAIKPVSGQSSCFILLEYIKFFFSSFDEVVIEREHFNENVFVLNPFQPSVTFLIETSHLVCTANQRTGFYKKCNIGLKWVNFKLDFYPLKIEILIAIHKLRMFWLI